MAAKEWYQVRPGRATMVEFSDGDVKIMKSGMVFEESPRNPCIIRLTRGKKPKLRKLCAEEIELMDLGDDPIVLLPDSAN